jgi:hypothetical protein
LDDKNFGELKTHGEYVTNDDYDFFLPILNNKFIIFNYALLMAMSTTPRVVTNGKITFSNHLKDYKIAKVISVF